MKFKLSFVTLMLLLTTGLYLTIPGCGNKNNNAPVSPYPPGSGFGYCPPGQFCNNNVGGFGVGGTSLTPGPVLASIDSRGSVAQLQFGGQSGVGGMGYNGAVQVQGVINLAPGGICPPGSYQIIGQGQWYGGSGIPAVQAQLQVQGPMGGGYLMMSGDVFQGPDPNAPQLNAPFYYKGIFQWSCDPWGTAL